MSESPNENNFLDADASCGFAANFDGYVLIFCAIILSALKVVELILKKKQNNNFIHLNAFENDLKKLQNDFVELSRIQTTDLSPELTEKKQKVEDVQKRFSKSASMMNQK